MKFKIDLDNNIMDREAPYRGAIILKFAHRVGHDPPHNILDARKLNYIGRGHSSSPFTGTVLLGNERKVDEPRSLRIALLQASGRR